MPEIVVEAERILKADDVKLEVTKEYLFQLGFLGVFYESLNSSDILGIRRSLQTVEVEVKVNKGDLISEITAIQNDTTRRCASTKRWKHNRYLGRVDSPAGYNFIPNEFYFAVPEPLVMCAISGVANTPYGVIGIGKYKGGYQNQHDYWGYHIVKRATKMHKNKIDIDIMAGLIRKTSFENYFLRKKLRESK